MLLDAQEKECARIARELHDDLGQSIALFNLRLQRVTTQARNHAPQLAEPLADLHQEINRIAQRASTISHELHSSELELLGLAGAAQRLCRDLSELHHIKVTFSAAPDASRSQAPETEFALFRVLQEALNNAAKHSGATAATVALEIKQGNLHLRIIDNGKGFDAKPGTVRKGLGLVSMAERVRLIGGQFSVMSEVGSGTTIEVRIPANGGNGDRSNHQLKKKQ
jgi:signal transduction histidine kinase